MNNLINFLTAGILAAAPLHFGELGATLTEKSGTMNLGVEGMMFMGGIAGRRADEVGVTCDKPRTEEPDASFADISAGAPGARVVTDRAEAIHHAVAEADGADVVLIAGKGHEDYQEINGVKHHFSDSEVVREAFNERRVQMLRAVEGV